MLGVTLQGFGDVDLGGDFNNRKSIPGYVFTLGGIITLKLVVLILILIRVNTAKNLKLVYL